MSFLDYEHWFIVQWGTHLYKQGSIKKFYILSESISQIFTANAQYRLKLKCKLRAMYS